MSDTLAVLVAGVAGLVTGAAAVGAWAVRAVRRAQASREAAPPSLEPLCAATRELAALPLDADCHQFLATRLLTLADARFAAISEYDEAADALVTRALAGGPAVLAKAAEVLGASPIGRSYRITSEAARADMVTGRLRPIPGGLYALAFGQIPQGVSSALELAFGVGDVLGIGLVWEGRLHGAAVLGLRRGTAPDVRAVELFAVDAAIALQRRATALAQRESEERYRAVFNGAMDSLCVYDFDGRVLDANEATLRLTGYPREDLIGMSLESLLGQEQMPRAVAAVEEVRATGSLARVLGFRIRTRSGEAREIECTASLISRGGQPYAVLVVARDTTERTRVAARQEALLHGLQEVLGAADELLATHDSEALLRRAVEAARARLGLARCSIWLRGESSREVTGTFGTDRHGQTVDERGTRFEAPIRWQTYALAPVHGGQPWYRLGPGALREWDGQQWVTIGEGWRVATPIRSSRRLLGVLFNDPGLTGAELDEDRQAIVAVFCSLLGHTLERQHAEEDLRASEARFRETADALPLCVYECDCEGRLTFANQAAYQEFGYPPEAIVCGLYARQMIPPDEWPRVAAAMAEVFQGRTTRGNEYAAMRADGSTFRAIVQSAPIRRGGQVVGLRGILLNISERKRAEQDRESLLQALAAKDRELEDVVYVTSHDLRTPLVNVLGFSQHLAKACTDLEAILRQPDTPEATRQAVAPILGERIPAALRFIRASGVKMDALVNGLLRLSRTGRAALHPVDLDMNRVLEDILSAMAFQAQKEGAVIEVEPLPACRGDSVQVSQVFANLLDNALKYRDPGRPLRVTVSGQPVAGCVVYTVADTGRGFGPEQAATIWQLFHRLDPTGSVPGDGLGLALTRRIVERHGGRIWVESEPGVGSRFHVELPAAAPAPAESATPTAAAGTPAAQE